MASKTTQLEPLLQEGPPSFSQQYSDQIKTRYVEEIVPIFVEIKDYHKQLVRFNEQVEAQKVSGIKVNHSKATKEKFSLASKLNQKSTIDAHLRTLKQFYTTTCEAIEQLRRDDRYDTIKEQVESDLVKIKQFFDGENEVLTQILKYLADDLKQVVKVSKIQDAMVSDKKVAAVLRERDERRKQTLARGNADMLAGLATMNLGQITGSIKEIYENMELKEMTDEEKEAHFIKERRRQNLVRMAQVQTETEALASDFEANLEYTLQLQKHNNEELRAQTEQIENILKTNQDIFTAIQRADLTITRIRAEAFFRKTMMHMIAVCLTIINLYIALKKI